jgi:dihydroorotase
MSNILLKNVTFPAGALANGKAPSQKNQLDLKIVDGMISEIGSGLKASENDVAYDCAGSAVLPGLIDVHTHLRDLGQKGTEDIASGTRAAAAGGYTTLLSMANTVPPIDGVMVLRHYLDQIKTSAVVQVIPAATVTKGMAGQELTNMVELAEAGAGAFSDDGKPIMNLAVLRRALEYAKLTDKIVISHPEDNDLSGDGSINESAQSVWLGCAGVPTASESACIAREIEVARYTKGRLHFAHVSAAASVSLIRRAKDDGLLVTADTTPHHLVLLDEDITTYDARLKMNPPLRSRSDQESLIAGLKDGTLDAIATDHAPHSVANKTKPFEQCINGVIGLETAFALVYERLVKAGFLSLPELISVLSTKPAGILGISAPRLAIGELANLTVVNLDQKWKYDVTKGLSKGLNSPFDGTTLIGKIFITVAGGNLAYVSEQLAPVAVSGH